MITQLIILLLSALIFLLFEDKRICEENRREFQKEIEKFSNPLASTATIYVDNPPVEGRYKLMVHEEHLAKYY